MHLIAGNLPVIARVIARLDIPAEDVSFVANDGESVIPSCQGAAAKVNYMPQ